MLTDRRVLAGLCALLALPLACGGNDKKAPNNPGGMASTPEGSNVPAPPPIDRSKCDDKGKQVVTADLNKDQKADVWRIYGSAQQGGQKQNAHGG